MDTIPYHTIPYHAMPCHAMPCHAMPYHTIKNHTIPYYIIVISNVVFSSDEDEEKTEFTRKRTWQTTTRETVTSVKKETRTELEVFVVPKSRKTGDYTPEDDLETERLDIQVRSSTVLPRDRPAQARDSEGSDQMVIVEGQIEQPMSSNETKNEIQQSNEKICLKIEHALGHKGR